jgi:purine-binding chemotaxis protein CheW
MGMVLSIVGGVRCALPVASVVETMPALSIEPIGEMSSYVLGLAIVRGAPIVVVDAGALLTGTRRGGTRFVILRAGERRIALLVDAVLDVRAIDPAILAELPPLLGKDLALTIGALDDALVVVLDAARMVPTDVWEKL